MEIHLRPFNELRHRLVLNVTTGSEDPDCRGEVWAYVIERKPGSDEPATVSIPLATFDKFFEGGTRETALAELKARGILMENNSQTPQIHYRIKGGKKVKHFRLNKEVMYGPDGGDETPKMQDEVLLEDDVDISISILAGASKTSGTCEIIKGLSVDNSIRAFQSNSAPSGLRH